jgi:hypothetical protein
MSILNRLTGVALITLSVVWIAHTLASFQPAPQSVERSQK